MSRNPPAVPGAPLSEREREVLAHVAEGLVNKEIAARLVVEPDTVKGHVESILRKLAARDRTHPAVLAVRRGLVP